MQIIPPHNSTKPKVHREQGKGSCQLNDMIRQLICHSILIAILELIVHRHHPSRRVLLRIMLLQSVGRVLVQISLDDRQAVIPPSHGIRELDDRLGMQNFDIVLEERRPERLVVCLCPQLPLHAVIEDGHELLRIALHSAIVGAQAPTIEREDRETDIV